MKNLRLKTTILLKAMTCVLVLTFASCDDDDDNGYGTVDQTFNSEYLV